MGFATTIDQNAAQAAEEAAAGGNGSFPPLPAGKYQATVAEVLEVVPFSKNKSEYAGKMAVRVKLRIVDESPTGKGRIFFERIPLFSRYAPSQKNPQGATVRAFWDFWERGVGVPREDILAGKELPSDIGGTRLTITLSAPIAPDEYNPLGSNEVSFYDKPGDVNATPRRQPGVPVAEWLDEHDNLIGGAQAAPAQGGNVTQMPQVTQTANPWGTQPVAATGTDVWATPQADPQLQAAVAASGKGF